MQDVVGVRFRDVGKIYHFDATGFEDLEPGEYVVVETSRGQEVGRVALAPADVSKDRVTERLKPVERRATSLDLVQMERHRLLEEEALAICQDKAREFGLPIKVLRAEYNYDGSHVVAYFVSEKRIDFRELVQELRKTLKTKVELRQVGVRDEAKLMGGVGRCGRLLCCTTFLPDFDPVSIRMAKRQDISLNPSEISGICGRLLCCLAYEDEYYQEVKKKLPKVRQIVRTSYGTGEVTALNCLKQTVTVELKNEVTVEVSADEILEVTGKGKRKHS
ncbi:MAG: stage 0 sporulation protein [Anaerolineae bacterium]|nr:stage 0 sporulation protein [Anaerolineae bacterium]NIN94384.1 stage 0 sporulation protein [Anaerolineae bacterium]NIQ77450.1 stage 0 sporulation protein [Anaerolineae bacterium]